jgi:hypothetical protein
MDTEYFQLPIPDVDDNPNTISTFWMHIDKMKTINEYNPDFQKNIGKLFSDHKIIGWKRSLGDGNCYFRAVITSYFLIINKPLMPSYLLDNFFDKVSILNIADLDYEYDEAQSYIIEKLKELKNIRTGKGLLAQYKKANEFIQTKEFDLNLIRVARALTQNLMEIKSNSDEYSFMFIEDKDYILTDAVTMGKEGGDLSLVFLPMSLGIQVIQFMFLDQPRFSVQKFPEEIENQKHIIINIIRRGAHYDILCTIQQMETELCNISNGTISLPKNSLPSKDSFIEYLKHLG